MIGHHCRNHPNEDHSILKQRLRIVLVGSMLDEHDFSLLVEADVLVMISPWDNYQRCQTFPFVWMLMVPCLLPDPIRQFFDPFHIENDQLFSC